MSSNLTMSDFFCGAGGSSTGARTVPGLHLAVAANHWQLAIDVHQANHPDTDHAAVDLHLEDPRYFPKTDIAWMSPECTKWSQGNSTPLPAIEEGLFEDPLSSEAASRSRLLMFDCLRYAEHHQYRAMVVENVIDIATQSKYRLAWQTWREQLRALGYNFRVVSLNSMHAQAFGPPAPQSRDRIYIVCWRQGDRAPDMERVLRPKAYCPKCDQVIEASQSWKNGKTVGRYRQTYLYVHGACGTVVEPGWLPAAAAIDWSIVGERIGDRLQPKTRLRIVMGIARHWSPIHIEALGNQYDAADPKHRNYGNLDAYYRAWSVDEPIRTLNTQETKGLAVPVEGRDGKEAFPLEWPMRTLTTRAETALAQPPFVSEFHGGGSVGHLASDPLSTVSAGGQHHALVMSYYSRDDAMRRASEPMPTVTTEPRHALVTPAGGSWNEDARDVREPLRTLTSRDAYALVHRMNSGGAEMSTPIFEELRTLTAAGHQALIQTGTVSGRPRVTPGDLKTAWEMLPEVLFRMFRPHEVAAGMAFPVAYRWDVRDSKGRMPSNRNLVKMAGNAVTPPSSRDILHPVCAALTGEAA